MKTLQFKSLLLLSKKSRKGKKLLFDPRMTIIKGTNDTGKSCAIKSLYYALGAETKQHPSWMSENVICMLRLSIDGIEYTFLRNGSFFAIFDSNDKLFGTYNSVTKELAPVLADLFNFKIKHVNRQNKDITPPPAYLYLPFYIDQDLSWQGNWNSFTKLQQLNGWKKPIIQFLTGIRPNEFYEVKTEIDKLKIRKNDINSEIKIQRHILDKLKADHEEIIMTYNIADFEEEINDLLGEINEINKNIDKYKRDLSDCFSHLHSLKHQKKILEEAKRELDADYHYATDELIDESVECPTCGAMYNNSFQERFEIAKDEDTCDSLLIDVLSDIKDTEKKIDLIKFSLSSDEEVTQKLKGIIESKRGKVTLNDIIQQESSKIAKKEIKREISLNEKELLDLELNIQEKKTEQQKYEDKERKKNIEEYFFDVMKKNLYALDVHTLEEKNFKKIDSNISEIGSDLPRSLLAYYYAVLQTIFDKSNTTRFPIVIDSPNQNAQDKESLKKMYRFIFDNSPQGSQIILGTEDLLDIEYDGDIIDLKHKYHLLQADEYETVNNEMEYYIKESFGVK